ncbi:MAG: hypothetical protein L0Y66_11990 [Myxococcaceae bacterium]|nr:hypothetical protein [Myxococcaceae bacterium]
MLRRTFVVDVFDAGQSVTWGAFSWLASLPPGTAVTLQVRTGNAPTPDASWSAFTPVTASGDAVGSTARYLQYRAFLSSSDTSLSPLLHEVRLNHP